MSHRWRILALLSLLASSLLVPTSAHTTIGNLNSEPSLHRSNDHQLNPANTFKGHVPGPLGHVWPGSGLNMYSGIDTYPPGYQSPFTTFEYPLQVAANAYAPEGAILTSTLERDNIGDLIFAINFSQPRSFITESNPNPVFCYQSIALYLPAPVFKKTGELIQDGFEPVGIDWDQGDNTNIITTVTDDYGGIFITRADVHDPFGPGCWIIYITSPLNFTASRDWSEWYYIRINQIKAPQVAGRYFFKIFLNDHYPNHRQEPQRLINSTMPMENWPVLLVKGEVDPGIIYGTVKHGNTGNALLYGLPLTLPGRVIASGSATDPVTGELTGRYVEARGYFNASSQGHFEVEGVAPGVYDIYASASGYPEQKIAENVRIRRGQSLMLDAFLNMGPVIKGRVFSKDENDLIPWPGQLPVSILIYDSDTYDQENIVAYSPTNLTHAPYVSYLKGNTLFSGAMLDPPNTPKAVAFPWEGPLSYYPYTPPPSFKDLYGLFNGVGPAQTWWVDPQASLDPITQLGSSQTDFFFQFGFESFYGIPSEFSGMVPQVFATWIDSIDPGVYFIRVFINGYVQTAADGYRFIDYPFVVPDLETPRDIFVAIDVLRSKAINVTVHFHNLPATLADKPIQGPDPQRFLIAEVFASDGTLAAFNFTQVSSTDRRVSILLNGFGMIGSLQPPDPRASIKYSLARYRGLYDYGLPSDTYTIRVYMRGYIQALPPASDFNHLDHPLTVTISLGAGVAEASTHMYRGCGINTTVYAVDWEYPHVGRNWMWDNAPVNVLVYDVASKAFVDAIYFYSSDLQQWMIPEQTSAYTILPWPGWKTVFGAGSSFLVTNGSTFTDRFGPDIPHFVSIDPSQDMATTLFLQENFHVGFLYSPFFYSTVDSRSTLALYPGIYALNTWTYGFVQEDVVRLGDLGDIQISTGWLGCISDSSLYVVVGVNFTITIVFKSEDLISGIPYNASVRFRVFDESDTLVAAATLSSHGGRLNPDLNTGFFADGEKIKGQAIPAGTEILSYIGLAGLLGYVEPTVSAQESIERATLFSPDYGVWGKWNQAGSYSGDWTVMVDIINLYLPSTFYPPVPALLQGESPFFLHYNHLGPYRQERYTTIPNVVQGGEVSIVFEMDLRGYLQGVVLGMDWNDDVRTISWATIMFEGDAPPYYWYSWDGWFDGYLDPGDYSIIVAEWTEVNEGHNVYGSEISVSQGQFKRAMTITLDLSGKPIPEFPNTSFILAATICLTLTYSILLSERKKNLRS